MFKLFNRLFNKIITILSAPIILADYFSKETGKEYGVGFFAKVLLIFKFFKNGKRIITASSLLEQIIMVKEILNIPKALDGVVVECGSYKGGGAANLSLVCAMCGRKLEVFDSFNGLPDPSESDRAHIIINANEIHAYSKGSWLGTLEEVKNNISKYGKINVCNFNVGYFKETLPKFKKKCAFIFLDVDLTDSEEECIKNLWPLLENGCKLYTHEAPHMEIASLFFDKEWWKKNIGSAPPGLIGAGNGLGLYPAKGGFASALGYSVKNPLMKNFINVPQTGL